jgi:uncharacterized protein YneF (UPF0154 family)
VKTGNAWLIFWLAVLAFALVGYFFSKRRDETRLRRRMQAIQQKRLQEMQQQRK